jgi:hypothetical protein
VKRAFPFGARSPPARDGGHPEEPRDGSTTASPAVRVYVGETVDISNAERTGRGVIGTNRTAFASTGDDTSGISPASADLDTVEPGSCDAERGGSDTEDGRRRR